MGLVDLYAWDQVGGVLRRRGRPDIISGFVEFAPGTMKPLGYRDEAAGLGARNVGPRTAALTPYAGDYTLTPGAKVTGLDISGRLIGRGDSTTVVSDCIIRGGPAKKAQDSAVIGNSFNLGGATIQWCRLEVGANDAFTDCIDGGNYAIKYCELYGGVDGGGMNTYGSASISCSRISHGYYDSWWDATANARRTTDYVDADGGQHFAPFPAQTSGDTHGDGIQIQQFSGWVVRGNNIGGTRPAGIPYVAHWDPTVPADWAKIKAYRLSSEYKTSCILISSATSAAKVGALIELNWFSGGATRFNIAWKSYDDMSGVRLLNNRFIRNGYGYYIYAQTNCAAEFTGNVMDDDGSDAPIFWW